MMQKLRITAGSVAAGTGAWIAMGDTGIFLRLGNVGAPGETRRDWLPILPCFPPRIRLDAARSDPRGVDTRW
jgi:hypothetical protein